MDIKILPNEVIVIENKAPRQVIIGPKENKDQRSTFRARRKARLNRLHNRRKKIYLGCLIAAAAILVLAFGNKAIMDNYPYAFNVGGKTICYVENEKAADEVVDALLEDYKVEGTEIRAVDTDGRLTVERSDKYNVKASKIKTVDEAVAAVAEAAAAEEEKKAFDVTVACTKTEILPYTPEPNYEMDETMICGTPVIKVEGVDGEQKVSTTYKTVNGEIKGELVTAKTILDEGSPATIVKGTLGLPEGEDWKTYEGNPVFNDGKDLVVTSQKYLGAPYKYGGYSLTNGIDCVQFVRALYKMYGIKLPNNHPGIRKSGVGVSLADAQAGDIVCYAPHHMGIYMGDGKVIHATHKGVRITDVHYGSKKIVTIRRIVK